MKKTATTRDNVKLTYYINKVDDKQPYLFFLHGAGSNHTIWNPFIEHFSERNYIVQDLRGHGDSEPGRLSNITVGNYAEDIKCIIESEGIEKVILIGNSLGASVAVEFSRLYPHHVHRMILFSIFSSRYIWFSLFFRIVNSLAYLMMKPFKMRKKLNFQDYVKMRDRMPWFFPIADIKGTNLHVYSKSIRELLKYELNLSNIEVKTLILQGKRDLITKNTNIYKTAGNQDDIRFKLLDAHHLIVNKEPELGVDEIKKYL